MHLLQEGYDIRCEWDLMGIQHLAPSSDIVIIVDVLSFSTCVDIAVERGAAVYPYRHGDDAAVTYARKMKALLANPVRTMEGYTLSPASLLTIPAGSRLVLPSPNGSALSTATGSVPTFTACLRNARAVAAACAKAGITISVIPAGERWPDGTLRPAIEDLIGAGAVISFLAAGRKLSPEAEVALGVFHQAQQRLRSHLGGCISGKELIDRGFERDIELAAGFDVSDAVPFLVNGAYTQYEGQHLDEDLAT